MRKSMLMCSLRCTMHTNHCCPPPSNHFHAIKAMFSLRHNIHGWRRHLIYLSGHYFDASHIIIHQTHPLSSSFLTKEQNPVEVKKKDTRRSIIWFCTESSARSMSWESSWRPCIMEAKTKYTQKRWHMRIAAMSVWALSTVSHTIIYRQGDMSLYFSLLLCKQTVRMNKLLLLTRTKGFERWDCLMWMHTHIHNTESMNEQSQDKFIICIHNVKPDLWKWEKIDDIFAIAIEFYSWTNLRWILAFNGSVLVRHETNDSTTLGNHTFASREGNSTTNHCGQLDKGM